MSTANEIQHGGLHYKKGGALQHWDVCARFNINYLESCASKYVTRHPDKNGLEDVQKADHYLMKAIELIDEIGYRPGGIVPREVVAEFCNANELPPLEAQFMLYCFRWEYRTHLVEARKILARIKDEHYPAA